MSLIQANELFDMLELWRQVTDMKPLCSVGRVLALDGANISRTAGTGRDQEHRILTPVLRLPKDLDRSVKHFLTDLGTKILKRLPANSVKRKVRPGSLSARRKAHDLLRGVGGGTIRDGHSLGHPPTIILSKCAQRGAYAAALPCTSCRIWIELNDLAFLEHAGDAERIDVGERGLVEQPRVHRAARGQVIDHHVEEFELVGRQRCGPE